MARLVLSKDFLPEYARLQRPVRQAVDAAMGKFLEHTYAGLHLEKVQNARDPRIRTIRINQFYRGVVLTAGAGDYVLLAVRPHDDAYDFATSRRFTVNQVLGVLEMRDEVRLEQLERTWVPASVPGLFDAISDRDLQRLGVEAALLPLVRMVTTDAHVDALAAVLPEAQHGVLTGLAAGLPVDEVWAEYAERVIADVDPEDVAGAVRRTPERFAVVSGPVELASILAHPFDAWRTFLHPLQRDIAYRDSYTGPALIKGSAGTGKTVTALHRAVFLATRLPADGSKVLVTTFTRTLAESLDRQVSLLTADRSVRERIEILGVDQLAYRVFAEGRGRQPNIATEDTVRALFDVAAKAGPVYLDSAGRPTRYSATFLQREWEQVILAQRLTTADAFLQVSRRGRGEALRVDQRRQVWEIISSVTAQLTKLRQHTHLQVADKAAEYAEGTSQGSYRHVVVDEGQDLHPAQWRLLRALVPRGPDDIFLVADPHQRIYDSQVSLASLGIEVRGRSRRLTLNYRTTHEILAWSIGVLNGEPAVGLDDSSDSLNGYRAVTNGPTPVLASFADRSAELDSLVERVGTWLDQGVEPHAIGVAARNRPLVTVIQDALRSAHIPVLDDRNTGVHVATMHRMKGLEFQCLAVVAVDASVLPAAKAVTDASEDPVSHRQDLQRERCLLFVAATRARDMLYLSHSGAPSPLLPA